MSNLTGAHLHGVPFDVASLTKLVSNQRLCETVYVGPACLSCNSYWGGNHKTHGLNLIATIKQSIVLIKRKEDDYDTVIKRIEDQLNDVGKALYGENAVWHCNLVESQDIDCSVYIQGFQRVRVEPVLDPMARLPKYIKGCGGDVESLRGWSSFYENRKNDGSRITYYVCPDNAKKFLKRSEVARHLKLNFLLAAAAVNPKSRRQ